MATLHEQAECLRLALLMGLIITDDVDRWATSIVDQTDLPSQVIIDLATSAKMSELEVADLLTKVAGEADLAKGAHMALALLQQRLRSGKVDVENACRMRYAYSQWAHVSEDEAQSANAFDERLYLVQSGAYGDSDGLLYDAIEFVSRYISLESEIPL